MTEAKNLECAACKYAQWKKTATGRLHPNGQGKCTYQVTIPLLPAAFFWTYRPYDDSRLISGGFIERHRVNSKPCPVRHTTAEQTS